MSRPISWVLLNVIINLVCLSPNTSSSLPKSSASSTYTFLFGLAPSGVYLATNITIDAVSSYLAFSPLQLSLRFIFCCTCRKFALPRSYLALYSMEPRLSSLYKSDYTVDSVLLDNKNYFFARCICFL